MFQMKVGTAIEVKMRALERRTVRIAMVSMTALERKSLRKAN